MTATTEQAAPQAKYTRHRAPTEIFKLAAAKGFKVDAMRYTHHGSDHITVYMPGRRGAVVGVMYNIVNGRFFYASSESGEYFTSDRPDYDGQPWFDAMLEFFLVPMEVA